MTFAIVPRIALLAAAVCVGAPARAQEPVINVYFEPLPAGELTPLNKAIQAALSQPPLQLATKPFAGAVIMTVPDRVEVSHKKVSGTAYSFTVAFSRDGSSLGQSQQSCTADKLSDCTDQLVLDVKSVAAAK
jgi:hypothetical protein